MKLANVLSHHIDLRFLFTPFAVTIWQVQNKDIKMYYVFGIRIIRIHLI